MKPRLLQLLGLALLATLVLSGASCAALAQNEPLATSDAALTSPTPLMTETTPGIGITSPQATAISPEIGITPLASSAARPTALVTPMTTPEAGITPLASSTARPTALVTPLAASSPQPAASAPAETAAASARAPAAAQATAAPRPTGTTQPSELPVTGTGEELNVLLGLLPLLALLLLAVPALIGWKTGRH